MRGRSSALAVGIACLLLAGAGSLLGEAARKRYMGRGGSVYQPAAATPRPTGTQLYLPAVNSVADFDLAGERLYLLDPLGPAVHRVNLGRDGPEYLGSFGRQGGGPGEFAAPSGITVLREQMRVAVIEPGRIHFFDLEGAYLESTAPVLPCLMPRQHLGAATRGLFVHGNCVRRAIDGDTMMTVLAWSSDGRVFRQLAADPLYTLDGRFGSAFGASNALGEGLGGEHVFGGGLQPCIHVVAESDSFPSVSRRCDSSFETFPLRVREDTRQALKQMVRRNPALARTMRIPGSNPAYFQPLMLAAGPALLRGYSEDSVVLRAFGSSRDHAVLPLASLVGCRREACLVIENRAAGVRLQLHRPADLAPRILSRSGGPDD